LLLGIDDHEREERGEELDDKAFVGAGVQALHTSCRQLAVHPALIARCRRNSARSTRLFGSMFCLRTGTNRTPASPSNYASISLLLSALSPVKHRGRPSSWLQVIAHAA